MKACDANAEELSAKLCLSVSLTEGSLKRQVRTARRVQRGCYKTWVQIAQIKTTHRPRPRTAQDPALRKTPHRMKFLRNSLASDVLQQGKPLRWEPKGVPTAKINLKAPQLSIVRIKNPRAVTHQEKRGFYWEFTPLSSPELLHDLGMQIKSRKRGWR